MSKHCCCKNNEDLTPPIEYGAAVSAFGGALLFISLVSKSALTLFFGVLFSVIGTGIFFIGILIGKPKLRRRK